MVSILVSAASPVYSTTSIPKKWDTPVELTFDKKMTVNVDNIKIKVKHVSGPNSKQTTVYQFFSQKKLICDLNQDAKYSYLGHLWTADLDGNDFKDFIISARKTSNKTSSCYGIILFQVMPGVFKRLDFETYRLSVNNIVDLFHDGKSEIILRSVRGMQAKNKIERGFFVSAGYRITNVSLKRMKFGEAGFPLFVRFSYNGLPKESMKLSDRQKHAVYDLLPEYIESEYL